MSVQAGDWVEVRSKEEILATLDENGRLEGMVFMPPMFAYCGKRFRVFKSAHKTCGGVIAPEGFSLPNGVHLEGVRCSGAGYGGCQALCNIFWKEQWLKPVEDGRSVATPHLTPPAPIAEGGATEAQVVAAISVPDTTTGEPIYKCQATTLLEFTTRLKWYDARQYVADVKSKNVSLWRVIRGLSFAAYAVFTKAQDERLGKPARWAYDRVHKLWGGLPYPRRRGLWPKGQKMPKGALNLQAGEWVRVKSYEEILKTLDANNKNRGLLFDPELAIHCGGVFRVKMRVERFIDEITGKLTVLKTDSIMLEDVYCQGHFAKNRYFCPRAILSWWREDWLERVEGDAEDRREPSMKAEARRATCARKELADA